MTYLVFTRLPDAAFKEEIALSFETQASLHEQLESVPLPSKSVYDLSSRLDKRSLEHVGEKGEDRVQRCKFGLGAGGRNFTVVDTREQFGEDGEIKDQRRSQKRILENLGVNVSVFISVL